MASHWLVLNRVFNNNKKKSSSSSKIIDPVPLGNVSVAKYVFQKLVSVNELEIGHIYFSYISIYGWQMS